VRRAVLVVATPGLLLAWAGGLTMLIPHFSEMYMRAGWMHGKLTVAVIATALTGVVTGKVRRVARDEALASPGLMWTLGILLVLLGAAAVVLAVLRPGA
jgi:uncharacterized membrane protein